VKDFTGNNIPSLETLQKLINDGDVSFLEKLMYFGKIIPGTASYWHHKKQSYILGLTIMLNRDEELHQFS